MVNIDFCDSRLGHGGMRSTLLLVLVMGGSLGAAEKEVPVTKVYQARFASDVAIKPGPILDESAWGEATLLTDFTFPWKTRSAPGTEFRALWDERSLYFAFRVEDDDIVLADDFRTKEDVVREDRVELFFALDEKLADYFCLEMDPLGRVFDYRASYYREFDHSWTLPGVKVVGHITDDGYVVQGAIPLKSLQSLGFPSAESGRPIKFGIYRAEFSHADESEWTESWISWVDPKTKTPDFHVPSSFGQLLLRKPR